MPKFKNSNATFWVIFNPCKFFRFCISVLFDRERAQIHWKNVSWMEGAIFSNLVENSIRYQREQKEESIKKTFLMLGYYLGKYHTIHSKSQVVLELESRSEVVILVGTFNKIPVVFFPIFPLSDVGSTKKFSSSKSLTCKKSKKMIFKPTKVAAKLIHSYIG